MQKNYDKTQEREAALIFGRLLSDITARVSLSPLCVEMSGPRASPLRQPAAQNKSSPRRRGSLG